MDDIPLASMPSIQTPLGRLYLVLSRDDVEKRVAALRRSYSLAQAGELKADREYYRAMQVEPHSPKLIASREAAMKRARQRTLKAAGEWLLAQQLLARYTHDSRQSDS